MALSATSQSFGGALELLREGKKVARTGWHGKGMWLELQVPTETSKMTVPYIFLTDPNDAVEGEDYILVPWLASQTDLLAEDWFEVV